MDMIIVLDISRICKIMISGEYVVANILTSSNKYIYSPSFQVLVRLLIIFSFLSTKEGIVDSVISKKSCVFIHYSRLLVIIMHSCCL